MPASKSRLSPIAAFLAALGLSMISLGCATESTVGELQHMVWDGRHSTMWRGTFYSGTKDGFHYFYHTMELQQDVILKIRESDIDIPTKGEYPLPREEWIAVRDLGIDGAPR